MTAPTTASAAASTAAAESAGTEYVILVKDTNGMWSSSTPRVTARSPEAAVRKHAETQGNKEGTFVAIPARSWKPTAVAKQTVTTLKLEEAK